MKIGYVYVCKKNDVKDYQEILTPHCQKVFIDVFDRKRLSMLLDQARKGDEIIVESLSHLGDDHIEIYLFVCEWVNMGRHIYVIDERLKINRYSDIKWLKKLADRESELISRKMYRFNVENDVRRVRCRSRKLTNSQVDKAIRMRLEKKAWSGQPLTWKALAGIFEVTEKTLRESVKKRTAFKLQSTGLNADKLLD